MKRNTTVLSFVGAAILGTLVSTLRPAAGQEPGYLNEVRQVVDSYAASLSSCDLTGLASSTSPPFHNKLRPRLSTCTTHQLGSFRRVAETVLEADLVQVTLLWTQADGVLEVVYVTVKKDGGRWVVAGGEVP